MENTFRAGAPRSRAPFVLSIETMHVNSFFCSGLPLITPSFFFLPISLPPPLPPISFIRYVRSCYVRRFVEQVAFIAQLRWLSLNDCTGIKFYRWNNARNAWRSAGIYYYYYIMCVVEKKPGRGLSDLFQLMNSRKRLRSSLRSAMNNRSALEIRRDLLRIQLHLIDSITIRWLRNAMWVMSDPIVFFSSLYSKSGGAGSEDYRTDFIT